MTVLSILGVCKYVCSKHTYRRYECARSSSAMPTQTERSDATTAQRIAAAADLLGRHGFAATSIDTVAAAAGVTKGAAYHHFANKTALFRAVFVRAQQDLAAELRAAAGTAGDPWEALALGCRTFLERCLDPAFRRTVLLDGPSVLGWETVREIQSGLALRVLAEGIAVATGEPLHEEIPPRAHLVFGALCEAGMLLARPG